MTNAIQATRFEPFAATVKQRLPTRNLMTTRPAPR